MSKVLDNGVVRDCTPEEEAEILARQAEAPQAPEEVTRRQGIQALLLEGVTEAMVEAKITEMVTDPLQRDLALAEFRTSQVFQRYRPLVVQIGPALGLDLDALFIKAKSLT